MRCEGQGDCLRVPLSEPRRFETSDHVLWWRYDERLRAASAELGGDGLTDEALEDLSASRPGTLPWQRGTNGVKELP